MQIKDILIHGGKVALFILGSAVIPALAAMYTHNADYMLFAPLINVIAAMAIKYSGITPNA